MAWKTLDKPTDENEDENVEMWRPTQPGEFRIGTLTEKDPDAGKFENSILYVFDGDPENPVEHQKVWKKWGNRNLNDWMRKVEVGTRVKVIYKASHPTQKGNPWQEYEVQTNDEDGGGEPSSSSSSSSSPKPNLIKADARDAPAYVDGLVADCLGAQIDITKKGLFNLAKSQLLKESPDFLEMVAKEIDNLKIPKE